MNGFWDLTLFLIRTSPKESRLSWVSIRTHELWVISPELPSVSCYGRWLCLEVMRCFKAKLIYSALFISTYIVPNTLSNAGNTEITTTVPACKELEKLSPSTHVQLSLASIMWKSALKASLETSSIRHYTEYCCPSCNLSKACDKKIFLGFQCC